MVVVVVVEGGGGRREWGGGGGGRGVLFPQSCWLSVLRPAVFGLVKPSCAEEGASCPNRPLLLSFRLSLVSADKVVAISRLWMEARGCRTAGC